MTAIGTTDTSTTAPVPHDARAARVALVDDHELLAHSAAYALRAHGIESHVVEVTTLAEIEAAVLRIQPQVVLLDLHLGLAGLSTPLIPTFRSAGIEVVVLTGETDRAAWGACIEAGAAALLEKRSSFDDLVERLRRIIAGDSAMPAFDRHDFLAALNEREAEVLQQLMRGCAAEEIAETTYVSIATVRSHIRAILQKLGVNSQLAAVAAATQAGWSADCSSPAA